MIRPVLFSILIVCLLSACVPVSPTRPALVTPVEALYPVSQPGVAEATSPQPETEAVSVTLSPTQEAEPSPTDTPEPTSAAPTPTATLVASPSATHTPESTAVSTRPTSTPAVVSALAGMVVTDTIPLAANDWLGSEMRTNHYALVQSASVANAQGYVFSLHVFLRQDILQTNPRNAWVLAFYRWDGRSNSLLGTVYPSPYTAQLLYPRAYGIANWDDAASSIAVLPYANSINDSVRHLFSLSGFVSDINHNQLPEFTMVAEYCPQVCLKPVYALEFFEIAANDRPVNLGRGFSGRIELETVSQEPWTLRAYDTYWYDPFIQIRLPVDVSWDGRQFVDVSYTDSQSRRDEIAALQSYVDAQAGWPFTSSQVEQNIWRQLLLYQQIGQRQDGLNAFLANTDAPKWPGSDQSTQCWLALARVHIQTQYDRNVSFTLFASRDEVFGNKPAKTVFKYVKKLVRSMTRPGYDLSACQVFVQPTPTRPPTQAPTGTPVPVLTTTPTP